jgi:aspartate-semialdehyde dehydrogenase
MAKRRWNVAIVGATGAVGTVMRRVLEERRFPVNQLKLLASGRSAGKRIDFLRQPHKVEVLTPEAFEGVDIALFSAGGARSLEFAPEAARRGAVVVDNSSAFRMDPQVPLVVPEVNPHAVAKHKGIIANPNCSTIIMLVALKPVHDLFGVKRVIVSTYQSVSGAGAKAMHQLWRETRALAKRWGRYKAEQSVEQVEGLVQSPLEEPLVMAHRVAHNLIPQIDVFQPDGYTKEELKMRLESRKIMELPRLRLSATCVRVPVYLAHSASVTVELKQAADLDALRRAWAKAPGLVVQDNPGKALYPMPIERGGQDAVSVGRLRRDPDDPKVVHFWCVGDNLRKGAATNAVQIAELVAQG